MAYCFLEVAFKPWLVFMDKGLIGFIMRNQLSKGILFVMRGIEGYHHLLPTCKHTNITNNKYNFSGTFYHMVVFLDLFSD